MNRLNYSRLIETVNYDPDSGAFTWNKSRKGCKPGKAIGTLKSNGYMHICIDGYKYLLHRLAWLYIYGDMPKNDIDHIDGCRNNNAIKNLRSVDRSTNLENIKIAKSHNKSTGMLGAYRSRDKFTSRIRVRGNDIYLGVFDTKEGAHEAYINAKRAMHNGNTL